MKTPVIKVSGVEWTVTCEVDGVLNTANFSFGDSGLAEFLADHCVDPEDDFLVTYTVEGVLTPRDYAYLGTSTMDAHDMYCGRRLRQG